MRIEASLDTGPILQQIMKQIDPDETAPELSARMAEAGAPLVIDTLKKLERGEITPAPQDERQATHAPAAEEGAWAN